jgi:HSP20 family protein
MDLVETPDHYVVRADLPGVRQDDLSVQFEDHTLTISGQRTAEHDPQEGFYRLERTFGAFSRSLALPEGINPDRVQAQFNLGVLQIMIPKPEQKKPRQVEIQLTRANEQALSIDGTETAAASAGESAPELATA